MLANHHPLAALSCEPHRDLVHAHAAAGKRKRVVHQHDIAAPGQFVSPSLAAIVVILMFGHQLMLIGSSPSNLLVTEVFIAAMVVQPQYGWQASGVILGFDDDGLRASSVGQLPADALDGEIIERFSRLQLDISNRGWLGLHQIIRDALPSRCSPCIEILKAILTEGEPGGWSPTMLAAQGP